MQYYTNKKNMKAGLVLCEKGKYIFDLRKNWTFFFMPNFLFRIDNIYDFESINTLTFIVRTSNEKTLVIKQYWLFISDQVFCIACYCIHGNFYYQVDYCFFNDFSLCCSLWQR